MDLCEKPFHVRNNFVSSSSWVIFIISDAALKLYHETSSVAFKLSNKVCLSLKLFGKTAFVFEVSVISLAMKNKHQSNKFFEVQWIEYSEVKHYKIRKHYENIETFEVIHDG